VADTDGTQKTWSFRANKAGAGVLQEEDIVEETLSAVRVNRRAKQRISTGLGGEGREARDREQGMRK
jgi:hypothetical protein